MSSRLRFLTKTKSNLRRTWKSMENFNRAAMDVQERSNPVGGKSRGLMARARERNSSESSDDAENENMSWQKEDLVFIAVAMEKLNKAFGSVDRYGQDVPCIRPVRELCAKLRVQLNGEYGTLNRTLQNLRSERVPGHKGILEAVESLRDAVNSIVNDEEDYIAKLEDIRQSLGELTGLAQTMLKLQY